MLNSKKSCTINKLISKKTKYVFYKGSLYLCIIQKNSTENVNLERIKIFSATLNCNLRILPFFQSALLRHIKRDTLRSGWEWKKREKKLFYK